MSDATPPAAPAAPAAEAPAAPAVEAPATPPAAAPKRHPYGAKPAARPVAAAPVAEATGAPADPKPAAPKGSRVLAMRERELAALRGEVEPLKAARAKYETLVAPLAERELATLPEAARAQLAKKHGKDAAGLLEEITYLRSIGAFAAPAAAPAGPPANTAPKTPPAPAIEADPDAVALREYTALTAAHMTARASAFLAQHKPAIERARARLRAAH